MIIKPIEVRYLHEEKIVFIEYVNSKPKVRIPIKYIYKHFIGREISSEQYIISLEAKEKSIDIEFNDQKVVSIIWENLLTFVNGFSTGTGLYE